MSTAFYDEVLVSLKSEIFVTYNPNHRPPTVQYFLKYSQKSWGSLRCHFWSDQNLWFASSTTRSGFMSVRLETDWKCKTGLSADGTSTNGSQQGSVYRESYITMFVCTLRVQWCKNHHLIRPWFILLAVDVFPISVRVGLRHPNLTTLWWRHPNLTTLWWRHPNLTTLW